MPDVRYRTKMPALSKDRSQINFLEYHPLKAGLCDHCHPISDCYQPSTRITISTCCHKIYFSNPRNVGDTSTYPFACYLVFSVDLQQLEYMYDVVEEVVAQFETRLQKKNTTAAFIKSLLSLVLLELEFWLCILPQCTWPRHGRGVWPQKGLCFHAQKKTFSYICRGFYRGAS